MDSQFKQECVLHIKISVNVNSGLFHMSVLYGIFIDYKLTLKYSFIKSIITYWCAILSLACEYKKNEKK